MVGILTFLLVILVSLYNFIIPEICWSKKWQLGTVVVAAAASAATTVVVVCLFAIKKVFILLITAI